MRYFLRSLLCIVLAMVFLLLPGCGASSDVEDTASETETTEATEATVLAYQDPADTDTIMRIHPDKKLRVIDNKVSNMNMWDYHDHWMEPYPEGHFEEIYPFVEEMQFMSATGGEPIRDLFQDPDNKEVLDDYDFSPLICACRNVVDQGLKPMIKTGSVPQKYSSVNTIGKYEVNMYPPDDYDVYYAYIQALTQALVDEFGLEEVKSWRWGCFVEYENGVWFRGSLEEYCRIYDYTVTAIQSVLGFDIKIGAHSMSSAEGRFDETKFIDHCINGTNYCTGEQGTRLTYLAASFYEKNLSGIFWYPDGLIKTISVLQNQVEASLSEARSAGITEEHLDALGVSSIYYGIDEGRVLAETKGRDLPDLFTRTVGHTKQAAHDALLLDQMLENDISYFSAWYYHADQFNGLPSISYHLASEFYKMVGTTQVETVNERHVEGSLHSRTQKSVASVDENGTVYAMVYDFGDDNNNRDKDKNNGNYVHVLMNMDCNKAKVTVTHVNDESNFFDEWMDVCEQGGLTSEDFSWSLDGPDLPRNLITGKGKQLFNDNLNENKNFTECAKLKTETIEVEITDGELYYHLPLDPNSVAFLKIEPME